MDALDAALDAAFAARPDPAAVPAASAAVLAEGEVVTAAWGCDRETRFQAASISKPVAAVAALRLAAAGVISLDRDVNDYLTSWRLPGQGSPVLIRHLLSHSGGVTVDGFPGYPPGTPRPALTQILDGQPPANTPPIRGEGAPGREHRYSGGGYTVLQQLLEDVTGEDFASLVTGLVLEPAGMTGAIYRQPPPDQIAPPTVDGAPSHPHVYPELAAAGLWCTPAGLVRFALAVQSAIAGEPGAMLAPGPASELVTVQVPPYGLGLRLSGSAPHQRFSHGGSTTATSAPWSPRSPAATPQPP